MRELDPARPTGRRAFHHNSEMLEDAYAMNGFILNKIELPLVG